MPQPNQDPLQPAPKQKSSAERPTVGRIVHVIVPSSEDDQPTAAIVTRVNDDGTIEASLFQPRTSNLVPAKHLQHESSAAEGDPRWRWPFRS